MDDQLTGPEAQASAQHELAVMTKVIEWRLKHDGQAPDDLTMKNIRSGVDYDFKASPPVAPPADQSNPDSWYSDAERKLHLRRKEKDGSAKAQAAWEQLSGLGVGAPHPDWASQWMEQHIEIAATEAAAEMPPDGALHPNPEVPSTSDPPRVALEKWMYRFQQTYHRSPSRADRKYFYLTRFGTPQQVQDFICEQVDRDLPTEEEWTAARKKAMLDADEHYREVTYPARHNGAAYNWNLTPAEQSEWEAVTEAAADDFERDHPEDEVLHYFEGEIEAGDPPGVKLGKWMKATHPTPTVQQRRAFLKKLCDEASAVLPAPGKSSANRNPILALAAFAILALLTVAALALFRGPSSKSGQASTNSGTGAQNAAGPATKPASAAKALADAELKKYADYLMMEIEKTSTVSAAAVQPAATIEFNRQVDTTVTVKPLLYHTKTTQAGAVFETTINSDGKGCTVASGVTTPFTQAPLGLASIQPWAILNGATGAEYAPDAPVAGHTDWVINTALPNPTVPGRTFSLNTAIVMINPKGDAIEEIDQHAMWIDSQAIIHQPDLHRDLTSTLQVQYDTGAKIVPCP